MRAIRLAGISLTVLLMTVNSSLLAQADTLSAKAQKRTGTTSKSEKTSPSESTNSGENTQSDHTSTKGETKQLAADCDPEPKGPAIGNIPMGKLEELCTQKNIAEGRVLLRSVRRTPETEYVRTIWEAIFDMRVSDEERAVAKLNKCLPLHDVTWRMKINCAVAFMQTDNPKVAIEILKDIPHKQCLSYGFQILGEAYNATNRPEAAYQNFETAGVMQGDYGAMNLLNAARAQMLLKRYTEAVSTLTRASKLTEAPKKDLGPILAERAKAYFSLGKNKESIADYTNAIQFGKKHGANGFTGIDYVVDAYKNRALCYDKLGDKAHGDSDRKEAANMSGSINLDMFGK